MRRWLFRMAAALWLSAVPFAVSRGALAQPAPQANPEAVALFNDARLLMDAGNYEAACPKLAESQRIDPGIGTLYNLADCYEHIGHLASAWTGFRDAAAMADDTKQSNRARAARERAAALEPKLSKLRITVSPTVASLEGVEVQRDGILVDMLLWGKDIPVDPGKHVVSASARGRQPFTIRITVKDPGAVIVVDVPELQEPSNLAKAPSTVGASKPARVDVPQPQLQKRSLVPVVVLGSTSLAAVGAGLGLFFVSNMHLEEAREITTEINRVDGTCNGTLVHPLCGELDAARSKVSTLDTLSFGAFTVGGLALAGMLVYLVRPVPVPRSAAANLNITIAPTPAKGGGGVAFFASF